MAQQHYKNRSNRKSHAPRHEYQVGDTVYFHAQPYKHKDQKDFICKGVILRQPARDSRVYKVMIVAVNPCSILAGHHPELAKLLLGKRLPRNVQHLMKTPSSGILGDAYTKTPWLEISTQALTKIHSSMNQKK